jgi:hypothetical protein
MLSGMLAHGSTPLCRYSNHERGSIACLLCAIYVIRSMDNLQEVHGAIIMRVKARVDAGEDADCLIKCKYGRQSSTSSFTNSKTS